jgi:hypothetical protein
MTPGYQPQPAQPGGGLGTAALVLGIVAVGLTVVLFCFPIFGAVAGVVAIILGGIAMSQSAQNPKAGSKGKVGLILGIVAIAIAGGIMIIGMMIGRATRKGGSYLQRKAAEIQKQAEEAEKKQQEEIQKLQNQTQPSSSIGSPMEWKLRSNFAGMPDRVVVLLMPHQA